MLTANKRLPDSVAITLRNAGLDELMDEYEPPREAAEVEIEADITSIHLQGIDDILAHAQEKNLSVRIMVLDIDETLLTYNEQTRSFDFLYQDSWLERMAKERDEDKKNNTLTVWGIGTFRYLEGGINHLSEDGEIVLRPEIAELLENFKEYINQNLIIATGGEGLDGNPGCKVTNILDWYHQDKGIPKENITIFDDQYENVINPALSAGYNAIHISPDKLEAINAIRRGDGKQRGFEEKSPTQAYPSFFGKVSYPDSRITSRLLGYCNATLTP